MGLAYTVDSPIKVAQYGISSVISIVDDELLENMRQFYSEKFGIAYKSITKNIDDFRAQRVTSYLNLVSKIVNNKIDNFKQELKESKKALDHYLDLLPSSSHFKQDLQKLVKYDDWKENLSLLIDEYIHPGSIDVNIMTKVDKVNFKGNTPLPVEYNDAHAALRGFAQSDLQSSIVLSAGMNPRLFTYFENFPDFFPDTEGNLKKKIILKVSDFRSANVQATILAKKGLWVSEYRIESGLNCGGHAFATEGLLLGPILHEFTEKKEQLTENLYQLVKEAWEKKNITPPKRRLTISVTAQGGVGTSAEHNFLLEEYCVDSVGWGSPFLLVPEATTVDPYSRDLLMKSKEKDLYLSNLSPLGVPFNTIRDTSNDFYRKERIRKEKPGSSCPKKYLALHTELDPKGLCTASKKLQNIQLKELEGQRNDLDISEFNKKYEDITEKACLCVGLANAALMVHELPIKGEKQGVAICPGPNIAYFDKEVSLKEMVQHIYGNHNVMTDSKRPFFLIKELQMYIKQLKKEIFENFENQQAKNRRRIDKFTSNLLDGVSYYKELFQKEKYNHLVKETDLIKEFEDLEREIMNISSMNLQLV